MDEKLKKRGRRILFSLAVFFIMLLLDKGGALPAVFENRFLSFLCFLIPYLFCGFSVLRDAVSGIRNRRPFDECFLMTIATIGAFLSGENAEAVAVMLFYQVGEWFQSYALGRTRRSISALMEIAPESANVERPDGSVETVDPEEVSIGDILLIRPGEKVVIVDDLIATGGTLEAACKLVEKLGGTVEKISVVMELAGLKGRERLKKYELESLIRYEGK